MYYGTAVTLKRQDTFKEKASTDYLRSLKYAPQSRLSVDVVGFKQVGGATCPNTLTEDRWFYLRNGHNKRENEFIGMASPAPFKVFKAAPPAPPIARKPIGFRGEGSVCFAFLPFSVYISCVCTARGSASIPLLVWSAASCHVHVCLLPEMGLLEKCLLALHCLRYLWWSRSSFVKLFRHKSVRN